MAIRIKYGNPFEVDQLVREYRRRIAEQEVDDQGGLERLKRTINQLNGQADRAPRVPRASDRVLAPALERQRRVRDVEDEGRRAARERREIGRERSGRLPDPRTDLFIDQREMARNMFEQELKDRAERDAYFRGQNTELVNNLFDPEVDTPGEGWAYSKNQQVELQRIAETANELISDPTLTEEERFRALAQLQNKKAMIRPNKVETPPPTAKEEWDNQVVPMFHPETGEFMGYSGRDRNGAFREIAGYKPEKPVAEKPGPDPAEQMDKWRDRYNDAYDRAFNRELRAAERSVGDEGSVDVDKVRKIAEWQALQAAGPRPSGAMAGSEVAAPGGMGPAAPAESVPMQPEQALPGEGDSSLGQLLVGTMQYAQDPLIGPWRAELVRLRSIESQRELTAEERERADYALELLVGARM